jgi:glucose-1-phosphate adenylyltransferase
MDYSRFIMEHRKKKADITIAVKPVPASKGHELGILKANSRGRITNFREKPRGQNLTEMKTDTGRLGLSASEARRRPYLGSMGIYLFRHDALKEALGTKENVIDFAKELIPEALKGLKVQAHLYDGYWEDIGTIGAFYGAHRDLVRPVPRFNLFDAKFPIYTHPRYLPGIKVNRSEIERSILNDGGIIERSAIRRSVIGVRARIGAGSSIEDSLVMGADYFDETEICGRRMPPVGIGKRCRIRRAIIDKNVRIGDRVVLENRKKLRTYDDPAERFYIRNGIIVVVKGAVIESGFSV